MQSPFPGMDPYLEHPVGWPNIHARLIVGMAQYLAPALRPRYYVSVEERVYVGMPDQPLTRNTPVFVPDVGLVEADQGAPVSRGSVITLARPLTVRVPAPERIKETYLEIRDARSGHDVVTVMEVLSPTNKRKGSGRDEYLKKREAVLRSRANLVEIDLLRAGERMPMLDAPEAYHYSVLISREWLRIKADFYPLDLQEPLGAFPIPLRRGEEEVVLDLGQVLADAYDQGGFDLFTNYHKPSEPSLSPEDQAWAEALLREHGITPAAEDGGDHSS